MVLLRVPAVYCDDNFIATALEEPEGFRNRLAELSRLN